MKLRLADTQDRTLAALQPGADVQVAMPGTLVQVYEANGVFCFLIDTPAGRISVAPIRDGSTIDPA